MKSSPRFPLRSLSLAGLVVFSATPAWAVFPFFFDLDLPRVDAGGEWTGDGTPQAGLNPASTTAQIAVQDFSSGTMMIDNMGGNVFTSGRLLTDPISATHTIALTGGTADLRLHNSNNFDAGGALFNSIGLTDFQGVTAVSWTINFSRPIAGRNETLTSLTTRPMGAGLNLIVAGSGLDLASFTVGMEYNQIYSSPTSGGEFNLGVPANALPFQSSGFGTAVAGATSFTSDAFSNLNEFLLVRGYDYDGTGGYSAADAPLVYITDMTWTIRRDNNAAFASNTLFTMSMDGQQYSNIANVPEPTSMMLVGGALVGACLRRRRQA